MNKQARKQHDTKLESLKRRNSTQTVRRPKRRSTTRGADSLSPFSGGEDRINISVWLEWDHSKLARQQRRLQGFRHIKSPAQSTFGSKKVTVIPGGEYYGNRKHGIRFEWKLHLGDDLDGAELCMNLCQPTGSIHNVCITIHGTLCLRRGALAALRDVQDWLSCLGATIVDEKLTRLDLCVDLPNIPSEQLIESFKAGKYTTRAKRPHRLLTTPASRPTMTLGDRRSTCLMIYDKLAEAKAQHDDFYLDTLKRLRWNGRLPMKATRVEFTLGRDALKYHGIRTFASYLKKRSWFAAYLTTKWTRALNQSGSKGNKHKLTTDPSWELVQRAFAQVYSHPPVPIRPVRRRNKRRSIDLVPSIVGSIMTMAAQERIRCDDADDLRAFTDRGL